jgi:hypothetical protein
LIPTELGQAIQGCNQKQEKEELLDRNGHTHDEILLFCNTHVKMEVTNTVSKLMSLAWVDAE